MSYTDTTVNKQYIVGWEHERVEILQQGGPNILYYIAVIIIYIGTTLTSRYTGDM